MAVTIEDEHGTPWAVKPGDPANAFVNSLKSLGFDYIVLSRYTLCRGRLPTATTPPGPSGATPDPGSLLRLIRLADCEGAL